MGIAWGGFLDVGRSPGPSGVPPGPLPPPFTLLTHAFLTPPTMIHPFISLYWGAHFFDNVGPADIGKKGKKEVESEARKGVK